MSKKSSNADAKRYEIMLILNPEIGEDGIKKRLKEIREHIEENSGEITHEDIWALRDLAYPIKKQEQGFYVIWNFTTPSEALKELNTMLLLEPEVLRFLITVLPSTYEPKNYFEEAEKAENEESSEEAKKKDTKKKTSSKKTSDDASESKKKKTSKKGSGELEPKDILENPDLNF